MLIDVFALYRSKYDAKLELNIVEPDKEDPFHLPD